jgi:DNA primase catalytic core
MNNFEKISDSCRFLLQNYPDAQACQDYLDSRVSKDCQEVFKFGYFPGMNNIDVISSLVGMDCLKESSLIFTKEIEDSLYPRTLNFCYFEDYPLIIPFRDCYGSVVALVGRTLLSEHERQEKSISKYKNTFGFTKTNHIFGLYENKKSIIEKDSVFLVEGQLDVIKSYEKGFNNVLGIGSASLSQYQFSLITRYTENVFLLLDNDEAGLKGRKRIIDKFGKYANIQNFYLPQKYKDIDEYLKDVSYENMELSIEN